jgi:segregation and condensation protein B
VSPEDQSPGNAAGGEGVGNDAVDWPGGGRPATEIGAPGTETGAGGVPEAAHPSEPVGTAEITGNQSLSRSEVETFSSSQDTDLGPVVPSSPPPGSPSTAGTATRNAFVEVALPGDDAPEINPPNAVPLAEAAAKPETNPSGAEPPAPAAGLETGSPSDEPRAEETPEINPHGVERPPGGDATPETSPPNAEPQAEDEDLETNPDGAERPAEDEELGTSPASAVAEGTPVSGSGLAAEDPSGDAIGPALAAESPAEAALVPDDAPAQPSVDPTQVREEATDHVALAAGPNPNPPTAEQAGLPDSDRTAAPAPSSAGADSAPSQTLPASSGPPEAGESLLVPDLADPAGADETGTAAAAEIAGPDGTTAPAEAALLATDPEPATDPAATPAAAGPADSDAASAAAQAPAGLESAEPSPLARAGNELPSPSTAEALEPAAPPAPGTADRPGDTDDAEPETSETRALEPAAPPAPGTADPPEHTEGVEPAPAEAEAPQFDAPAARGTADPPEHTGGAEPAASEAEGSLFGADLVVADASLDVPERLRATLEAVLLVVDQPTSAMLLAQVLGRPVGMIEEALRHLRDEYDSGRRGLDLREVAGGWRLYTRDEFAIHVERFVLEGQVTRLTQAALETLAVIAYRQPITRSRVSAVRGVNVDAVMRTLLSRSLVEECGSDAETGGGLYRTTQLFLERLGISSLDELPSLAPLLPDTSQLDDVALST